MMRSVILFYLLRMNGGSDQSAALAPHWPAHIIVLPAGFAGQNLNRERCDRVAQSPYVGVNFPVTHLLQQICESKTQ